jgi:hypothetical protein
VTNYVQIALFEVLEELAASLFREVPESISRMFM